MRCCFCFLSRACLSVALTHSVSDVPAPPLFHLSLALSLSNLFDSCSICLNVSSLSLLCPFEFCLYLSVTLSDVSVSASDLFDVCGSVSVLSDATLLVSEGLRGIRGIPMEISEEREVLAEGSTLSLIWHS